jgi:hypothetical protein
LPKGQRGLAALDVDGAYRSAGTYDTQKEATAEWRTAEEKVSGWTGTSFADDYKGISQAIESGNWIDGAIRASARP